jgi:hypothetical protein
VQPAPAAQWPYRIRHHWIVLLKPPGKWGWLGLAVLVVIGITGHWLGWIPLILVLGAVAFFRTQEWRAEIVELDPLTIRHARGVKETSVSRALMRIDRVSGVVLSQTVPGKILGYGSLHLEAPGNHPGFRDIEKIQQPDETFQLLQSLMFRTSRDTDPDDVGPDDQATAPLPGFSADGDTGQLPSSRRG